MSTLFTEPFFTALVLGALTAGLPLLLAGLGEQISEKAGVLNIGIEGMMLAGAYGGFLVAYHTGSIWLGYLGGALGGMAVATPMAVLCIRLGLSQIVIGMALTLGAEGTTALLHHFQFAQSYPRLPAVATLAIPGLSAIPVIGPALFDRPPIVYLAILAVFLTAYVFRSTHLGLALQAAGDKPEALDAAGVDVVRLRSLAVLATGCLAGVGGAFMAEVGAGIFVPFMTNGAGFIGIVLAMQARGRPFGVLWGALLFGACLSAATALQVAGVSIPTDVVQMLPFVAVLAVLVLLGRKASLPPALGVHYVRGGR
ncbi:putative B6 ABC transporter permease subunit 1 [Ancylobacter lacus]|uniref:putative B6 ABC transporter permease subunit 1 n=1 Tax=Ancylobacter lacus TaxID=2579970 RepID=UPI001BCBCF07|nr:ABC transporter permease [Ancylobacter lacus]MBS7539854.1 ABC transporter permease [Ancylobacter lacus]